MNDNILRFNTVDTFKEHFRMGEEFLAIGLHRIAWGDSFENKSQESTNKALYIDGITSVGKSTLMSNLQILLPDSIFLPEFLAPIPEKYRNISEQMPTVDYLRAEFWFYNQFVRKNQLIKQSKTDVVSDRGPLSLFAYSNMFGDQQEVSLRIMRHANQINWARGLHIFLTAHPEAIRERMISRPDIARIHVDQWDNGMQEFITVLSENLQNIATKAKIPVIDTTEMSPVSVTQKVLELYYEFLGD